MQAELMCRKPAVITGRNMSQHQGYHRGNDVSRDSREAIHSGHFMVSDFEADDQDDEDELAVPVPEEEAAKLAIVAPPGFSLERFVNISNAEKSSQQLSIETSLNKLFQCMSLAYRQKLTSPKWNRFKGIRLRWKDKIRLNNVIWRCWHMQFILKQNTLVCQFASPLDVDTHNKPEAVVLEGKYWKRKLAAVTAEYKKWRMFYRNKILGWTNKDGIDMLESMDMLDWGNGGMGSSGGFSSGLMNSHGNISGLQGPDSMMVDEDYMELMTDTLFSTISSNQPIYFPDPREIARGASLADFIQPSLGPLQPNLDDFMDTLEPLQVYLNSKLTPVPEEDDLFRSTTLNSTYSDLELMSSINQVSNLQSPQPQNPSQMPQASSTIPQPPPTPPVPLQTLQYPTKYIQAPPQPSQIYRPLSTSPDAYQNQREKPQRPGRSPSRSNRTIQHQSSPTFPTYQTSYNQLDMGTIQNSQNTPQMALNNLQDSSFNNRGIKELSTAVPGIGECFKGIGSQGFKIGQGTQGNQPFKFRGNNLKNVGQNVPQQMTVTVSSASPVSSHILLQCKPPGLDLTAPTLHPAKLLPKGGEKEEIFAVPKYQMKVKSRSRSSSALSGQRNHPPPLVSAVSDPAINVSNNVLLAQLLTNNSAGLYTVSTGPDKMTGLGGGQSTGGKGMMQMIQGGSSGGQLNSSGRAQLNSPGAAQSQGSPSGMLLSSSQSQGSPGSPKDSSGVHSPQALSLSPLHSPMSLGSPLSPGSRIYVKGEREGGGYKEQRRVGHIHAEQKRRYNIKNGFDTLHNLIPQLSQNSNTKLSKAAMLQKGAEYIRQLRNERTQIKEEMENLRQQIECLNTSISNCQSMLPATGAPVSRQRTNKMKEMFDEYVRKRTRENWKFWIFSILLEPLMVSFNTSVSTASVEDLCRSTILWVEQHCSLVDLRPAVLNSLRYLCTATEILSDPGRLPEEALAAVNHTERRKSMQ
ncbi:carbohydrate-responsive element-binding protein isoform X1 [Diachasmimorpha longicaudata]|uniref:carbohydrate-responsive element-binding protein isoform X1 n=2 Tax=Diachasmimorpha longicaudata TaxID=58733 RepID=UPI0030B89B03